MKLSTAVLLSRSRTSADRSRIRLTTAAAGLSGALLMGALRIARLGPGDLPKTRYSNYLAEEGLRPGVITVFVVLAVLAAGLAAQALRIGVAARERRLDAIRLAGGSSRQLKQLGIVDAALAGLAGGLLAAPFYLGLSLLFGALPRMGRLLPGIDAVDLPAWLACVLATTAAGAMIGRSLTTYRSPTGPSPSTGGLRAIVTIGMILVAMFLIIGSFNFDYLVMLVALPVLAFFVAPRSIRILGRKLTDSGAPLNVLAGARLIADHRPTGRIGALLGFCGLILGYLTNSTVNLVVTRLNLTTDAGFYLTGFAFAILGLLLIVATAFVALLVGMTDQLVDQRRQLASLTAFGVDARFLRRVLERQLALACCPALAAGLLVGFLLGPSRGLPEELGGSVGLGLPALALIGLLLAGIGAGCGLLGAHLAGYLLRNHVQDALAPENLRAA